MEMNVVRVSNPHLLSGLMIDPVSGTRQATCTCGWMSTCVMTSTGAADEWEDHVWRVIRNREGPSRMSA